MIHTARQSGKFRRLVRWLRPRVAIQSSLISVETVAVGLLESLWHMAISNAQRGDIGSHFDNVDIAEGIGWFGDTDEIIDAFVDTGWLDRCDEFRLVIHDWEDHAPGFIKRNIARKGGFAVVERPLNDSGESLSGRLPTQVSKEDPTHNITKHNQTKPNLTKEEGATEVAESVAAEPLDGGLVSWIEWWNTLYAASLVPCGVRKGSPAKAVVKAWNRVRRDPGLRDALSQRDVIERELRQCEFVRGASWLRPEKMLGGKNRDGTVIVQKLIEGGFRDSQKPKGRIKHDSRNGELLGGTGAVGTLG